MNIPKRLLVHTCTYKEPTGYGRDGGATYGTPSSLTFVRLEPVLATAKSDIGETKDDRLTLYYAVGVSSPAITPKEGALVTWNNADYTIRSVQPCYTQNTGDVHHYEAALV